MRLPPLHALSISAFTPRAKVPTKVDDEYLELPDWRTPREEWRLDILRFLVSRARVEGVEFDNANGVVFDEEMLFRQAGYVHPFAPVLCTPGEYRYFAEADYFAEEGGIELYKKHLAESGVGAMFKLLEDGGPDITVKQAIAKAEPRPARLKLLLELLEGGQNALLTKYRNPEDCQQFNREQIFLPLSLSSASQKGGKSYSDVRVPLPKSQKKSQSSSP